MQKEELDISTGDEARDVVVEEFVNGFQEPGTGNELNWLWILPTVGPAKQQDGELVSPSSQETGL